MTSAPAGPRRGLLTATLTLVAGGAVAQMLPLLAGPWLARLYTPAQFGAFHLYAAVVANLAVIACARYEFALPLVNDDVEALALRRLCLRLLAGAVVVAAAVSIAWYLATARAWVLWLSPTVGALGLLSLETLWTTRAQHFRGLAVSRVVQYGGGALVQLLAGLAGAGVMGLAIGPLLGGGAAAWVLARAVPAPRRSTGAAAAWRPLAQRFRTFPLLNTPHAFAGALQDTVALALVASFAGPVAAGFWGLSMRYLKAPASLVGGATSQVLYSQLSAAGGSGTVTPEARASVRRVMVTLLALAMPLVAVLFAGGPWLFSHLFGARWEGAGRLARALAPYIGVHFVAAPLAVVTLAWDAQGWALRVALAGQVLFVAALFAGLMLGGLVVAGWAVSLAMCCYFGYYFVRLATWPLSPADGASSPAPAGAGVAT